MTNLPQDYRWNKLAELMYGEPVRSELLRNEIHNVDVLDAPCAIINYAVGEDIYLPTANGTITAYAVGGEEDTATTGTGAWELNITYLDENYNEATQTKAMSGTTPITFDSQGMRINKAWVGQCGSVGTNVRAIIFEHDGTPFFGIYQGHGRGYNSYTVPNGYAGYVVEVSAGVRANKTNEYADIHLELRQELAPIEGWQHISDNVAVASSQYTNLIVGEPIRTGSTMYPSVHSVSANGLSLYANYRLVLFEV